MIICVRYFFEKTNDDYEEYKREWNENASRMIFLEIDLPKNKQLNVLIQNIQNNQNRDILSINFPNKRIFNNNEILKQMLNGEGIKHNNGIWYPKEIWIYNPI